MTLTKTCHASNMVHRARLDKINSRAYCNHKSFMSRDVSVVLLLY